MLAVRAGPFSPLMLPNNAGPLISPLNELICSGKMCLRKDLTYSNIRPSFADKHSVKSCVACEHEMRAALLFS